MLKRLELVGFKSFADKTTFDFGRGITAIVGPNGSGKSNVVDAVRWILGEQSAKSLRGGEMTDVIFNGSASRRSFGMAEVSITFDHARQVLASDAAEVQVTRRVYRSGEGEYLINGQPCRLKDVKDLFLGSGAGADAYCIIAQGKVDVMLQASTKERRTIFEEAAGISRFKAKKVETLRKLERVDQNVQRLRDIIDEVDKQLRSVKLQAAKAQRHQEYAARLEALRVGLGLRECHHVARSLHVEEQTLALLRGSLDQGHARTAGWEAEQRDLEASLASLDDELRREEGELGEARQRIKALETTLGHEHGLSADLEQEQARLRRGVNELTSHMTALLRAMHLAGRDLQDGVTQAQRQRQAVQALEEGLQAIVGRVTQLQEQLEADKALHLELMRQAAHLQNDAVSYKAQVDNLQRELTRLRQKSEHAAGVLASIDVELEELTGAEAALQGRVARSREQLAREKAEAERLRRCCDEANETLSDLRQRRSALASRAEVLEGLERSHEGLGTGVAELLDLLEQSRRQRDASCPWMANVIGMVADFLSVRREFAPLVDLALGDWSQRFVVRDAAALAAALAARPQPFAGRVSFLPLRASRAGDAGARPPHIEVSLLGQGRPLRPAVAAGDHPGLVARADQLVSTDHPELQGLPGQLLGRTLIVHDLLVARQLAGHAAGFRLVTLQGELLEPDGTLTVGLHHAESGILSRKSELREVRDRLADLDRRTADAESDLAALRDRVAVTDSRVQALQQEAQVLGEQAADLRSRLEVHSSRRQDLREEVTLGQDEMQRVEAEIASLRQAWREAEGQAATAEAQVHALQQRIAEAEAEVRQREQHRQARHQEWTAGKVALAKVEERAAGLQARHQQLLRDLEQRRHELAHGEQNLQACRGRLRDSGRAMLAASSALAELYVRKERAERLVVTLSADRAARRQRRAALLEQIQSVRGQWQAQQEKFHEHELRANELRHKKDTLAVRLREDYQLDLDTLYAQALAAGLWGEVQPHAGPGTMPLHPQTLPPDNSIEAAEGQDGSPLTLSEADYVPEAAPPAGTEEAAFLPPFPPNEGIGGEGDGGLTPAPPSFPWQIPEDADAANDEITELRGKLQRLGSVNLDSLQELHDLEIRAATLGAQYEDLTSAKRSLQEIIEKINADSRRLFQETYETIRGHFQELFRKLFGGGMADIVLEDEADILESGIEIVARPPGKELRSISLMSGGEKTMTAVALLLSIFRSRPSPFCILDEVDAALDEANIGRFADVLRDFLDHSHFIIITHSKRTMAAADVIYGVTMQESGISKRVSVRFEDWPDDASGHAAPAQQVA